MRHSKNSTNPAAHHVFGLLSPGGVHSHEDQIFALLRDAAERGVKQIYLHAFLDGRDTPPRSAEPSLRAAQELLAELGCGQLASIVGRYYAMDRDQRWDRIERAYNLIVRGEAPFHAQDGVSALQQAYKRDESDEFVQPTAIHGANDIPVSLKPEDAVIFMNFRADRARQITRALTEPQFDGFDRRSFVPLTDFVTLTRYAQDIDLPCAFDQQKFSNTLGEYLANLGKRQLRIAETEKYAHVTFFFSGSIEQPYEGEERMLIPSPDVATYDLQPEMSAAEVTINWNPPFAAAARHYHHRFANGDMVGHTGKLEAAIKAVQTLDHCLGRLVQAIDETGGQMLVTADHGNVEQMLDDSNGQEHTAHTHNAVPLVYLGQQDVAFSDGGTLSGVAPTLLDLMHLEKPAKMTGHSLVTSTLCECVTPRQQGPRGPDVSGPSLLTLWAGYLTTPQFALAAPSAEETAAVLKSTVERLNALNEWFSETERKIGWLVELQRSDRDIAQLNPAVARISAALEEIEESGRVRTRRTELGRLRQEQAALIATHISASHRLRGQDYKQLLNQESPDTFARMIRYHRYFSESRLSTVQTYQQTLTDLEQTNAALTAQQQRQTERQRTARRTTDSG